jgi:hypothetical protein
LAGRTSTVPAAVFATSAVLVYAVAAVDVDDDDELDELAAAVDDDEGLLLPPQPDNASALAQTAMSTYEWSFFTVHLLQLRIERSRASSGP